MEIGRPQYLQLAYYLRVQKKHTDIAIILQKVIDEKLLHIQKSNDYFPIFGKGTKMHKIYGYCRISRKQQSIDRQIRNIKTKHPDAVIV